MPSQRLSILAAVLLAAVACGGSRAGTTPTVPSPTPGDPCQVQPGGPGGPITDPNGPYYHQVVIARTADGVTLAAMHQVLDHASVPDGARLPDGSIAIYYVNGAEGGVWMARLVGDVATPVGPISLNGISKPGGVVDPDATPLPDGRIRLAYLSNLAPLGGSASRSMCVAESSDGVNFQVVGPAITFAAGGTETDPSLVSLLDGSWLMAVSRGQQTIMTRSSDGLSFSAYDTLGYGGVPELARLSDGRVRLYVCAAGIESYVSNDTGRSWQRETTVVPAGTLGKRIVCDPSMVSGTDVFIFKTGS
jgi:hypothetical protein